jgi:ABC-type oligopeptide transport system ATPase subunit
MANQQQQQQVVPLFHTVFVEHAARYEFIAHSIEMSSKKL